MIPSDGGESLEVGTRKSEFRCNSFLFSRNYFLHVNSEGTELVGPQFPSSFASLALHVGLVWNPHSKSR